MTDEVAATTAPAVTETTEIDYLHDEAKIKALHETHKALQAKTAPDDMRGMIMAVVESMLDGIGQKISQKMLLIKEGARITYDAQTFVAHQERASLYGVVDQSVKELQDFFADFKWLNQQILAIYKFVDEYYPAPAGEKLKSLIKSPIIKPLEMLHLKKSAKNKRKVK